MNRPLCWACTFIGTVAAFAIFAAYDAQPRPVQPTLVVSVPAVHVPAVQA